MNLKKIVVFIVVILLLSTLLFWQIQSSYHKAILLIVFTLSAAYLGKRNIDKVILFIPTLIGFLIVYFLKR